MIVMANPHEAIVDAMREGAEEAIRLVAPCDLWRFKILPEPSHDRLGSNFRSGHYAARAAGFADGVVAVRVAVDRIVGMALDGLGIHPVTLAAARAHVDRVAIHEAAHSLEHDIDPVTTADEAKVVVDAAYSRPSGKGNKYHGPRWASLMTIMAVRLLALRPERERRWLFAAVESDLRQYGHSFPILATVVGAVPDETSLRSWAADDSLAALVESHRNLSATVAA